jgi:hypothetical protein
MDGDKHEIHQTLKAINDAWRNGRPEDMRAHLHPDIVMKMPGFSGEASGREAFIGGFREFAAKARVLAYSESDEQIDVVGRCAIITFKYEMIYETATSKNESSGRDFWVFEKRGKRWTALWRTLMDIHETRSLLRQAPMESTRAVKGRIPSRKESP